MFLSTLNFVASIIRPILKTPNNSSNKFKLEYIYYTLGEKLAVFYKI